MAFTDRMVSDMKKPVLVVMAAGMGSRFGGPKQITPVDPEGHVIMDFSVYDAVKAGFDEILFVIKKDNEKAFREVVGDRISSVAKVKYVFQEMSNTPDKAKVPEGRTKPWGTGHAVLSCKEFIDGPFAVINADDYYGPSAFKLIYEHLSNQVDDEKFRYMMLGFRLGNTLTENGHVSRGVCKLDDEDKLSSITERVYIVKTDDGAAYSEDEGKTLTAISPEETVSMNLWGFTSSFIGELEKSFADFYKNELQKNPLKAEFFLPAVVGDLIDEGRAEVSVIKSPDKWYGMTYKEDMDSVALAIAELKRSGVYPEKLWNK